jgi:hypothetical protein
MVMKRERNEVDSIYEELSEEPVDGAFENAILAARKHDSNNEEIGSCSTDEVEAT